MTTLLYVLAATLTASAVLYGGLLAAGWATSGRGDLDTSPEEET